MVTPHEQSSPKVADAAVDSVAAAEPSLEGRWKRPEERQADGYEAYAEATKRREAASPDDELDEETVRPYKKAADDLLAADAGSRRNHRSVNPFNMLTRAACLGWQAEATPSGEFYKAPHSHVNVKATLQELAMKELDEANAILLGDDPDREALAGEMTNMSPVLAGAIVGAAKKAGTDEHILLRELGGVDEGIQERLVAQGKDGINRFIGGHAMEAVHSGRFTALAAEREATAVHELPPETAPPEVAVAA